MEKVKKILSCLWPILVIALVVAVFFWKFFLKGLVPLPADITVGMYYPWLDYKWGYAVGVPVKNSLLSDAVSQMYPFKTYALGLVKNGSLPLWNPMMFGGYPLLGNIQIGIFNPTNLLFLFLPFPGAWSWQTLLQPFLIAFFTYLFLRSLPVGKMAGLLGGLIFGFSGFAIIWLEWNVHGFALAFLPLLFFLTNRYFQKEGDSTTGALIALAVAGQVFSGYPQMIIYTLLGLAIFIFSQFKFSLKKLLSWVFWLGAGFMVSAIQLWPSLELFLNSQRRWEVLAGEGSFLSWPSLLTLLAPDFFGNQTTGNYWGRTDYTQSMGYSGVVAVILAGAAITRIKKEKRVCFFFILFVLSLLLALPTPLSLWAGFKFLGQGAMAASRALCLTNFSLACLAALAFDFFWQGKEGKTNLRPFYLPLIGLGGVGLGVFLAKSQFNRLAGLVQDPFSQNILTVWQNNLQVGFRNLLLPSATVMAAGVLLLLARKMAGFRRKIVLIALSALAVGELFRFGWKFTPFSRPDLIFPETPVISFLKNQPGIFRVEGGKVIPMNMLLPYGLQSFSAYDPMYPLRVSQYLSLTDADSIEKPKSRYGQLDGYTSSLLDLANICYLLSLKEDKDSRPDPQGSPGYQFRFPKFRLVFEDKTVAVLKNTACFPRARLFYDYQVEKESGKAAELLGKEKVDIRKTVVLEKDPGVLISPPEKEGKVEWLSSLPGESLLSVSTASPAILFISDSRYPGWNVYLDGKKGEIIGADYLFESVAVPAGEHQVRFSYEPRSFERGKLISLGTMAFILIFLLWKKLPLFKKTINGYTYLHGKKEEFKSES